MIYKNFIFDFGGVLYDIAPELSMKAFLELSDNPDYLKSKNFDELLSLRGFIDFEKGSINENDFRNFIRKEFFINKSDEDIDKAWNKTLVGLRPDAVETVKQFANQGNIYLLSNTNSIHYKYFIVQCKEMFNQFDGLFFSFELGLRKPEIEIFNHLLKKNNLNPHETIFFDDVLSNLDGANSCSLSTFHITTCVSLSDLFHTISRCTQYNY